MKAELIAVGTEILTGQITNTNAQFLSEKLAELGIDVYFHTAVGDNEQVVSSLGVNKNLVKVLGLAISNGLVSLAGSLTAQHQGFSDVTMGTGIVVMGLAAVIIGVSIFGKISFIKVTTLSIFGAIIYKLVIAVALWMKLNPNDLKILTAVLVAIALAANNNVFKFKRKKSNTKSINDKGGDDDAKDSGIMQGF